MADKSREGAPQFHRISLSLSLPSEKSQKQIKINKTFWNGVPLNRAEYYSYFLDYLYFTFSLSYLT